MYRYEGIYEDVMSPELGKLAGPRFVERARLLGAMMRVVYLLSAAMPGVMPKLKWVKRDDGGLTLTVPREHAALMGERPEARLAQLAKVSGLDLKLSLAD